MSDPLSFRLNESDPDQAQALALISAWRQEGHSLPEIITQAVLALAAKTRQADESLALAGELRAALGEVQRLADTIQRAPVQTAATPPAEPEPSTIDLSDTLLSAVARNVRRSKRRE